jgi:hypothetical protein
MMWQNFMPALSDDDAVYLAEKFDFSGGQIENITRKSTVSFILKGKTPDIAELKAICKEELMEKEASRIGFAS